MLFVVRVVHCMTLYDNILTSDAPTLRLYWIQVSALSAKLKKRNSGKCLLCRVHVPCKVCRRDPALDPR